MATAALPWPRAAGRPRRAGVSAFGFGGSNFHCVLEEHEARPDAVDWRGQPQIVAVSANDRAGLVAALRRFADARDFTELRRLAARSRSEFDPRAQERCCVVIERDASIRDAIERAVKTIGERTRVHAGDVAHARGPAPGNLGALFPGQGAQYVGMLGDLACAFAEARQGLEDADRAVPGLVDAIHPRDAFADRIGNEGGHRIIRAPAARGIRSRPTRADCRTRRR